MTAEPTAAARCSRSAPMASAASTHCAATSVAADATAMSVRAPRSSLPDPDDDDAAAVAAATAATAAATAATDTAACTCALCARVSSFFLSRRSLSHRPTVLLPPRAYGCGLGVLASLQNCILFFQKGICSVTVQLIKDCIFFFLHRVAIKRNFGMFGAPKMNAVMLQKLNRL